MGLFSRSSDDEPETDSTDDVDMTISANQFCPQCRSGRVIRTDDNAVIGAIHKFGTGGIPNFKCNECSHVFREENLLGPRDVGENPVTS